jgi:signal transduction histidine kinase
MTDVQELIEKRSGPRRLADRTADDEPDIDPNDERVLAEKRAELLFKTEKLLHFRLSFAAAGVVLCIGIGLMARADLDFPQLMVTIFGVVVYSAAALFILHRKIIHSPHLIPVLNALLISCDVLVLTGLVHYTRGVESDLYVLYLLPILLSSYVFGRRGIFGTAFLVSLSYVGLLLAENARLLPFILDPHNQSGLAQAYSQQLWRRILARSALLVSVTFIWGRFCEYMSGLERHSANRLRDQLLANNDLVEEVKATAARERLINSINSALRSTLDLNRIFETAVDELGKALSASCCAIVCPSAYEDELPIVCESVHSSEAADGDSDSKAGAPDLKSVVAGARRATDARGATDAQGTVTDAQGAVTDARGVVTDARSTATDARSTSTDTPGTATNAPDTATNSRDADEKSLFFGANICAFVLNNKSKYERDRDHEVIKIFLFTNPADEPFFAPVREDLKRLNFSSLIIKPMMYADQSKGVLLIAERDQNREWTGSELQLVNSVAGQVAVAIEHAELVDQLSRKNKDLIQKNLNLDAKNLELRAIQSQLIHQEKMASLGRLVAGIAHELNNPINFVHGNLPYLRNYFEDLKKLVNSLDSLPDEYKKEIGALKKELRYEFLVKDLDNILADLNEGADRIRHIIRNLKSFSRLDEAELKEASLQEGIESTLKILSQYYGRDKIPAQCNFAELPPILCYPGQLNQVWMNLLSNAAQAVEGRPEPTVKVSTEMEDGKVLVTVSDNGAGIRPEVQSKIFEPFFTTKPVGQGTGLGLSICHSIIERHGGQIWCESTPVTGTTFRVRIPIYARPDDLRERAKALGNDPD